MARRAGAPIKALLVFLNVALIVGLLVLLQVFGIVDFSPYYSWILGDTEEKVAVEEDPGVLQDIEEMDKRKEILNERYNQLQEKKEQLEEWEKQLEIQQHTLSVFARDLDERAQMLSDKEKQIMNRDSRVNFVAKKINTMDEETATNILIGQEISDIIAILREIEAMAIAEGQPSRVSQFISKMEEINQDKTREIMKAFLTYPEEENLIPNE